jgi:hypothetical protein
MAFLKAQIQTSDAPLNTEWLVVDMVPSFEHFCSVAG